MSVNWLTSKNGYVKVLGLVTITKGRQILRANKSCFGLVRSIELSCLKKDLMSVDHRWISHCVLLTAYSVYYTPELIRLPPPTVKRTTWSIFKYQIFWINPSKGMGCSLFSLQLSVVLGYQSLSGCVCNPMAFSNVMEPPCRPRC